MVIDKRTFFTLRLSKNIAAIENEKERMEALSSVQPEARKLIEATVTAIRSPRQAS